MLKAERSRTTRRARPARERQLTGEEKAVAGVWIQTIGQITEALGLQEAIHDKERKGEIVKQGERRALIGVWVQSVGQILEAVGVTKQLLGNRREQLDGRILSIQGNWLQASGSSLEAIGGMEDLRDFQIDITI